MYCTRFNDNIDPDIQYENSKAMAFLRLRAEDCNKK